MNLKSDAFLQGTQKLLAWFVAIVLVLSSCPILALAEDPKDLVTPTAAESAAWSHYVETNGCGRYVNGDAFIREMRRNTNNANIDNPYVGEAYADILIASESGAYDGVPIELVFMDFAGWLQFGTGAHSVDLEGGSGYLAATVAGLDSVMGMWKNVLGYDLDHRSELQRLSQTQYVSLDPKTPTVSVTPYTLDGSPADYCVMVSLEGVNPYEYEYLPRVREGVTDSSFIDGTSYIHVAAAAEDHARYLVHSGKVTMEELTEIGYFTNTDNMNLQWQPQFKPSDFTYLAADAMPSVQGFGREANTIISAADAYAQTFDAMVENNGVYSDTQASFMISDATSVGSGLNPLYSEDFSNTMKLTGLSASLYRRVKSTVATVGKLKNGNSQTVSWRDPKDH